MSLYERKPLTRPEAFVAVVIMLMDLPLVVLAAIEAVKRFGKQQITKRELLGKKS